LSPLLPADEPLTAAGLVELLAGDAVDAVGEAATTSRPPWRKMATVFEPIRLVPPMTASFSLPSFVDDWRTLNGLIQVTKTPGPPTRVHNATVRI
jgi:hypothetical protein